MTKCVNYWAKLISLPNYRYPKQTYIMLHEAGRTSWALHVTNTLLFRFVFGYA